MMQTKTTY